MGYWRHVSEAEHEVSPGRWRTFYRRLIGLDDGIENVEMIVAEMKVGGSSLLHFHDECEQVMYILEGTMQVEIEGERAELSAGHAVWVPRGAIHEVNNAGSEPLRFLLIYAPPRR